LLAYTVWTVVTDPPAWSSSSCGRPQVATQGPFKKEITMTKKLPLWLGALALSAVAIAGPKTYDVVLSTSAKAGSTQLAAGEYKVKVEGSNAIFTGPQGRESVTVPVKVENGDTKYNSTVLDTSKQGDSVLITSIELGGSKIKLEFAK
jgi:hypothetical protein